jgi:hypothetical protein
MEGFKMKWMQIWKGISLQRRLSVAFWMVLLALSVRTGPRVLILLAGLMLLKDLYVTFREVRRLQTERQQQEMPRDPHTD